MWIFYLFFLAGAFLAGVFFFEATAFFLVDLLLFLTGFFFLLLDTLPFLDLLDLLTVFFSTTSFGGEVVG
jgi:hypothetical protein